MTRRWCRRTAFLVAVISVTFVACGDGGGGGDEKAADNAVPGTVLPSGPLPSEPEYPEVKLGPVVKVGDTVWSMAAVESVADSITVSAKLESTLTAWVRPGVGPAEQALLHEWEPMTVVLEPEQVVPVVQSTPVTTGMGLDGEFRLLGGEVVPGDVENLEWAQPWSVEPVEATSVSSDPDEDDDPYYLGWQASFNSADPVAGVVLCFGDAGSLVGGSLGETEGSGRFTVRVVTDAGNEDPTDVGDPDKRRPYPEMCRLYPQDN